MVYMVATAPLPQDSISRLSPGSIRQSIIQQAPAAAPGSAGHWTAQLQHRRAAPAEGNAACRCTKVLLSKTELLCYCGVNILNYSKGKNLDCAIQSAITITVLYLGPSPTYQSMEICFWRKRKNTPHWTRWIALQILHFSYVSALVETTTWSSLSLTP